MAEKNLQHYTKQLIRQSGTFFAGMIFTTLGGFFFKMYIAHELGAESLGIYAMGMSIVAIVSGFSSLGLARSGIRFISHYKAQRKWYFLRAYLQRTTIITFLLGLILASLVFIFRDWISITLFKKPQGGGYLIWFSVIILLSSLHGLMEAFAQGYQNVGRQTIIGSFIKFPVKVGASIGLIFLGYGLTGYIIGELIAMTVSLFLFTLLIWRLTPTAVKNIRNIKRVPWDKSLISLAGVFLGIKILGMFSGEIDKLVLGGFMSPTDVGVYSIVMTLGGFIFILLRSLNTVFAPIIAELHSLQKHEELKQIYYAATRWITILSAPLAVSLIVNGNSFLRLFGEEFTNGSIALSIIATGYLINVSFGPIGMIAQMTGLEKKLFRFQIITQVTSLILFWVLIPLLGIIGASIAISVNNVLANILISSVVHRERNIFIIDRNYLLLILSFVIISCALWYINEQFLVIDTVWLSIISSLLISTIFVISIVFINRTYLNDLKLIISRLKESRKK